MDESPLEKLLRLATVDVGGFQRVERGRVQHVRPHTETTAAAEAAAQKGWVPQPLWQDNEWKAGSGVSRAAHDAAHDTASRTAHDTASRTAKATDAKDELAFQAREHAREEAFGAAKQARATVRSRAAASPGGRTHASSSPRAEARAQRMAARSGSLNRTFAGKPSGRLQDRVEQMEQDRQDEHDRVSGHPLFSPDQHTPASTGQLSPSQQIMHDAATRAVQDAAVKSGAVTPAMMVHALAEMDQMRNRLESFNIDAEAKKVEEQVTRDRQTEAKAVMALNILGIIASILFVAVTGGVGALIGEVMAFGWTVEVGKELLQYHGIESGKHPKIKQALAYPGAHVRDVGSTVGHVATAKAAPAAHKAAAAGHSAAVKAKAAPSAAAHKAASAGHSAAARTVQVAVKVKDLKVPKPKSSTS